MIAVLLVDHGSRRADANMALEETARDVSAGLGGAFVYPAHLEIASPNIGEGFVACVNAGAAHIVVIPYFLGPGRHTREDIPREVAAAAAEHPTVTYAITAPLGPDPRLVALVCARAGEAGVVPSEP